ncbi:hypothetical protein FT641_19740 [Bacillus paranthracis]|uniref:hypothetical protein n=1 Tax=Bacillus paranthracis TaxID=2026186 RepID=UPI0018799DBB|nr:hypothetical protein [Bacillus paranthracis]MBE7114706.1 hypothetical protein [Bacillus paranthracis]MBE7154927.1 hypothetical protein [Bacillus paranthracis]
MKRRLTITFTIINDVNEKLTIRDLVDKVQMGFRFRGEVYIEMEDYKRLQDTYTVEIRVMGEEDLLYQAIEEFKYTFRNTTKEKIKHTIYDEELLIIER